MRVRFSPFALMYEYQIVDSVQGAWWPELFTEGHEEVMFRDLAYLESRYPHREFRIERREVGAWELWDVSSETA